MLRRAPRFLRVVEAGGEFDALDQLHDQPRHGEKITVYVLTAFNGRAHVLRRGPGAQSGWYVMADYRVFSPQPPDDFVRRNESWQQWTLANKDQLPEVVQ